MDKLHKIAATYAQKTDERAIAWQQKDNWTAAAAGGYLYGMYYILQELGIEVKGLNKPLTDKPKELVEYLRNQAFWANHLAYLIEHGQPIEDYLWTTDLADKIRAQHLNLYLQKDGGAA